MLQETQTNVGRLILALLLSPLLSSLFVFVLYGVIDSVYKDFDTSTSIKMAIFLAIPGGVTAYLGYIPGIPIFLLLRKYKLYSCYYWLIGGLLSGLISYMVLVYSPRPGWPFLDITLYISCCTAVIFWLIEVRGNPRYQKNKSQNLSDLV